MVAMRVRHALKDLQYFAVERFDGSRERNRDRIGLAGDKRAGGEIRPVSNFFSRTLNSLASGFRDADIVSIGQGKSHSGL